MSADRNRTAVYAAEIAAFEGTDLEDVVNFNVAFERGSKLLGSRWWPGGDVDIRRARRDANSSSTRCTVGPDGADGQVVIRLAASQTTMTTLAHELAHALVGPQRGHDDVFRRAYLDVVLVMTNLNSTDRRRSLHTDQLAGALAAFDLTVGKRQWPEPPPQDGGGAFAL